jgi:predicted esterase
VILEALLVSLAVLAAGCSRAESELRQAPALPSAPSARAENRVLPPSTSASSAPAVSSVGLARAEPAPSAPSAPAEPPPLAGEPLVALEVPGFAPAVVALPLGARSRKPVVVALHGNFDRPDWQCSVWAPIVAARAFVLCPRGAARRDVPKSWDRWEYHSGKAVRAELDAGLSALRERFGDYVDDGPLIFIGFSLGAIYGVPLIQKSPERFPRAVLIEGGLGAWSAASAKRYVKGGGQRLLIACGQLDCMARIKTLVPALERAGLPTRGGGSSRAGHTYDGPVAEVIAQNWQWLVEGDPRFEP